MLYLTQARGNTTFQSQGWNHTFSHLSSNNRDCKASGTLSSLRLPNVGLCKGVWSKVDWEGMELAPGVASPPWIPVWRNTRIPVWITYFPDVSRKESFPKPWVIQKIFAQGDPVVRGGDYFTVDIPWPPTPLFPSPSTQSLKTHFARKLWWSLYGWSSQPIVKESQRSIPNSAQVTDPSCTPQGYIPSYSFPWRGLQKNQVMVFSAWKRSSVMAQDALFLSIGKHSLIDFHYTWQTDTKSTRQADMRSRCEVSVPKSF